MEQLHAHDCHQDVAETSGHRNYMWHTKNTNKSTNKKYKHVSNTGTVSQPIAQWSNPAGLYGCAAHCMVAHHVLWNTYEYESVAYTKKAWKDEALSSICGNTLAEWLQHRNCESGKNTRNFAIVHRGVSIYSMYRQTDISFSHMTIHWYLVHPATQENLVNFSGALMKLLQILCTIR